MFLPILTIVLLVAFFLIMGMQYRQQAQVTKNRGITEVKDLRKALLETEDLARNLDNLPYSKVLHLILHHRMLRIYRVLESKVDDEQNPYPERIELENKTIENLKIYGRDESYYRQPDGEAQALRQLQQIRKLRQLINAELKGHTPIDPESCRAEMERLYNLSLKVNLSHLLWRIEERRAFHQYNSCLELVMRGLEVFDEVPDDDEWFAEMQKQYYILKDEFESLIQVERNHKYALSEKISEHDKEMNSIFGDKIKW